MSDDVFLAICVSGAVGLYVLVCWLWVRADRDWEDQ